MRDSEHQDENETKARKRMATEMVQMAMEMGMGGLMGASNGGGVSESKDHGAQSQ